MTTYRECRLIEGAVIECGVYQNAVVEVESAQTTSLEVHSEAAPVSAIEGLADVCRVAAAVRDTFDHLHLLAKGMSGT